MSFSNKRFGVVGRTRGVLFGLLCGCITTNAYAASAMPEVVPQQIYTHSICGDASPGVRFVADAGSLAQVIKGGQSKLGALPLVDFSRSYVLLISMGSQRTGGYALRYHSAPLVITDGIAQLVVEWIKPRPGQMVIQMLTQPCIVLSLPKGPFNKLEVKDQFGRSLGMATIE